MISLARGVILASLLHASLGFPSEAHAQQCPVSLPSNDPDLGYKWRAGGPRCEGTFIQPVSGGTSIALVSLTLGKVAYRLGADQELHVRLPEGATDTRIVGTGLPLQRYYRLDARIDPSNRLLRVPLGDVIGPARIPDRDLGVLGWRQQPGAVVSYVPVVAAAPGQHQPSGIIAIIRPGANVTNLRWRLVPSQGGAPTPWQPVEGGAGFVAEGTRLTITLPSTLPAPRSTLQVTYNAQGIPDTESFALVPP